MALHLTIACIIVLDILQLCASDTLVVQTKQGTLQVRDASATMVAKLSLSRVICRRLEELVYGAPFLMLRKSLLPSPSLEFGEFVE